MANANILALILDFFHINDKVVFVIFVICTYLRAATFLFFLHKVH